MQPQLPNMYLEQEQNGTELKAACGPHYNANTGRPFAAFTDNERSRLEDIIKHQGRTTFKHSTPMSDLRKVALLKKAPTEQDLNQYDIDIQGVDIATDERRTLSTAGGKRRGEYHELNVTARYEYSESCFQCGRTDQIMRTHEQTNVREVMGDTRWRDLSELVHRDYMRIQTGKKGVFQLLQSVTIIARWDGQERQFRSKKQHKWHDRMALSATNPVYAWDEFAGRRKVVIPLMGGGIIAVDHLQSLMQGARHDDQWEIPRKELFNYVVSARLLDKVPNIDERKRINVNDIRKGFFKSRLGPILKVVQVREPYSRVTGHKIPDGRWNPRDYRLQDQGGYDWRVTHRTVEFCAVHFCSGQGTKGTVLPPLQGMSIQNPLFSKLVDAPTHISNVENAPSIAVFGLNSEDRETTQYLCGPRDYIQAPQPEGKTHVPPDNIEVTLSTWKADDYLEMSIHLASAVGPKVVPAEVIDMIVKTSKVSLKRKHDVLGPGEKATKNRKNLRSNYKYFPNSYDFDRIALYHRFFEDKVPVGIARVVESYLHRDGDYYRTLENPVL